MDRCPIPGCTTITDQPFMCRNHWRLLTKQEHIDLRAGRLTVKRAAELVRQRDHGYHGRKKNFDPDKAGRRPVRVR